MRPASCDRVRRRREAVRATAAGRARPHAAKGRGRPRGPRRRRSSPSPERPSPPPRRAAGPPPGCSAPQRCAPLPTAASSDACARAPSSAPPRSSPCCAGAVTGCGSWCPSGRTGVPRGSPPTATRPGAVEVPIHVDRSARRLTVRRGGRMPRRVRVAVGRPGTETPTGRFAVTDKLHTKRADSPYGCCALALSGHQPKLLPGWPGGDRLAIRAPPRSPRRSAPPPRSGAFTPKPAICRRSCRSCRSGRRSSSVREHSVN